MKNSEIHNGLDKQEIRDFLSMQLVKLFEKDCAVPKVEIPYYTVPVLEWTIRMYQRDIDVLQVRMKILKEKQSVLNLINIMNWQEFDVSDDTQNDTGHKIWMSFIGTESEFNELHSRLIA